MMMTLGGGGGGGSGSGMGGMSGGMERGSGSSERLSGVEPVDNRQYRHRPPRVLSRTGAGATAGIAPATSAAAASASAVPAAAPHRPRPRPVPAARKTHTQAPADRVYTAYPPAPAPAPAAPALSHFEQKAEELRVRVEADIATHEAKDALRRAGKLPVREVFGSTTVFGALTGDAVSGESVADVDAEDEDTYGKAVGRYDDDEIGDGQMKRTEGQDRRSCQNPACFNEGSLVCAACEAVHYCSPDCQKMHWPAHKIICAQMRKG